MGNKDHTRRKYLAMSGSVFGAITVPTGAAASKPTDIDTSFDPSNESEVINFTQDLEQVENLDQVYQHLSTEQVQAVREVSQPKETKFSVEAETIDGTEVSYSESRSKRAHRIREDDGLNPLRVFAQSSAEIERVTYRAYTTGLPPYDELWSFGTEATWSYDGEEVDNVSYKHAAETSHPLWHYSGIIDETENILDSAFTVYKQAEFEYCEPLQFGCVGSDTPYIEIIGDADGDHEVRSNYDV